MQDLQTIVKTELWFPILGLTTHSTCSELLMALGHDVNSFTLPEFCGLLHTVVQFIQVLTKRCFADEIEMVIRNPTVCWLQLFMFFVFRSEYGLSWLAMYAVLAGQVVYMGGFTERCRNSGCQFKAWRPQIRCWISKSHLCTPNRCGGYGKLATMRSCWVWQWKVQLVWDCQF